MIIETLKKGLVLDTELTLANSNIVKMLPDVMKDSMIAQFKGANVLMDEEFIFINSSLKKLKATYNIEEETDSNVVIKGKDVEQGMEAKVNVIHHNDYFEVQVEMMGQKIDLYFRPQ